MDSNPLRVLAAAGLAVVAALAVPGAARAETGSAQEPSLTVTDISQGAFANVRHTSTDTCRSSGAVTMCQDVRSSAGQATWVVYADLGTAPAPQTAVDVEMSANDGSGPAVGTAEASVTSRWVAITWGGVQIVGQPRLALTTALTADGAAYALDCTNTLASPFGDGTYNSNGCVLSA